MRRAVLLWALLQPATQARPAGAQAVDRALALGDSSWVDLGHPDDAFDLVEGGERTFALWIRYLRPEYHAKIIAKGTALEFDIGWALFVHQYSGTLGIWLNTGEGPDPSAYRVRGTAGLRPIGDGAWHHVALVQRDSLLSGYVDGELDWETSLNPAPRDVANASVLRLGWDGDDVIHFQGEMDDLSIWSRALSRREIRALMFHQPGGDELALEGYWAMDDDGEAVRDGSPHGRHGLAHQTSRLPSTRPTAPPFRETPLFYATMALLATGLLYGVMRLYGLRLERQKRRLEDQVVERTTALARAHAEIAETLEVVEAQASRLAELDRTKSQIFTQISHELRTPLTLIMGPLADIQDGRRGEVSPAVREHVGGALQSSRRLLRLTTQLIDLARLEAGALQLTVYRVDLVALLEGLVLAFAPAAEGKGVRFERALPAGPCHVYGDPQRLETVFSNLLSNAFKFTPAGGTVRLVACADGERATVRVEDTGPGIPSDELPRIFERFYQTETGVRQGQGSGIGLALVKELVELHEGVVDAESLPGGGTTLVVSLRLGREHLAGAPQVLAVHDEPPPLERSAESGAVPDRVAGAAAPGDAGRPANALEEEGERALVLVVDDNAEVLSYVRSHLTGFRVDEARNGREALARARERTPDLVLSDVMMPEMDGLELLRALREDPELSFVPVILLTARAELEDRVEGLQSGADDYLSKPFQPAELTARVDNLIERGRSLKERLRAVAAASSNPVGGGEAGVGASGPAAAQEGLEARLRRAIEANLGDEEFGVDALAAAVFMERTGLYRHTLEELGTTPSDLIREVRLNRAAALLRERGNTVSEVAYAVGYRSVSSFSRRFRDRFGCSPAAYARLAAS